MTDHDGRRKPLAVPVALRVSNDAFWAWVECREMVRDVCLSGPQIDGVAGRIVDARDPYRWPW